MSNLPTHKEHKAAAALLDMWYDWRDGSFNMIKGRAGTEDVLMLDALTMEPLDALTAGQRRRGELPGWNYNERDGSMPFSKQKLPSTPSARADDADD